jgi:hypothetical protein
MQRLYLLRADAILISHVLIIACNVFSLPLIWLGIVMARRRRTSKAKC